MKKGWLCLFAALGLWCGAWAQEPGNGPEETAVSTPELRRNVRRFEAEMAWGATFGYARLADQSNMCMGFCGGTEYRYNLRRTPLDVGLHFFGSFYWREPRASCTARFYNSFRMMGVVDYNLAVARRVECFFGAGLGVVFVGPKADMPVGDAAEWSSRFGAMPRIGVECWSHLRLTLGYVWTERANNHLMMTVGVVFGGGRR